MADLSVGGKMHVPCSTQAGSFEGGMAEKYTSRRFHQQRQIVVAN
jgi:hypothetical protein